MKIKNRLRNNLVRKIQRMSTDKLTEVSKYLNKIEQELQSKEQTLKLAGSWKKIDDELFTNFTDMLHDNRAKDRKID